MILAVNVVLQLVMKRSEIRRRARTMLPKRWEQRWRRGMCGGDDPAYLYMCWLSGAGNKWGGAQFEVPGPRCLQRSEL